MSGSAPAFRLRILPGSARIARVGDGVLVVGAGDARHDDVRGALLATLRDVCQGEESPGDLLVRRVVAAVLERAPEDVPAFAALAPARRGVAVLLTPGMALTWLDGQQRHTLSGAEATTWLDRVVPWEAGRLAIGVEPVGDAEPDPLSDLRDGVVTGGGAVVEWEARPSEDAEEARGEVEDDETRLQAAAPKGPPPAVSVSVVAPPRAAGESPPPPAAFEVVALGEVSEAEARPPLPVADAVSARQLGLPSVQEAPPRESVPQAPIVEGVRCARDHFNHPYARYCARCGIDMGQRTPVMVRGPRPPLGILVVDDGSAFTLDADYVVGREPELDPAVASGRARPLVLPSPERSVSRVHADIRLVGWDVTLSDRGSVNGTFVLGSGAANWSQVFADQSATLTPGSRVSIGQRTFVYESHHLR